MLEHLIDPFFPLVVELIGAKTAKARIVALTKLIGFILLIIGLMCGVAGIFYMLCYLYVQITS